MVCDPSGLRAACVVTGPDFRTTFGGLGFLLRGMTVHRKVKVVVEAGWR